MNNNTNNIKDSIVKVGENFSIELLSNPTTGYSWNFSLSSNRVQFINQDYLLSKNTIGNKVTEIFKFKALKEGEENIIFTYARSWEKKTPLKEYLYKIHIQT